MKKTRTDSINEITDIMAEARKDIAPPAHIKLTDKEIPFWNVIIAARAEWTDVDLCHAANLARLLCLIEMEGQALDPEEKGNTARIYLINSLTSKAIALSSKIQVHAAATIGESKLSRGKNTAKRQARKASDPEKTANPDEDDDLIARPSIQ